MMFIVSLKFSHNRAEAGQYMEAHNAWVQQGFEDGVFLAVGGIQPGIGGAVLAFNISKDELEQRLREDPFVECEVVRTEIMEISLAKVDDRLRFLLDQPVAI